MGRVVRAVRVALLASAMMGQAVSALQLPPPVHLTSEQDHQRTMDLLHISSLRRGVDGSDPKVAQRREL